MRAEILERDAGARYKILDRARDHNIVGTSESGDPRGDEHCDAPEVMCTAMPLMSLFAISTSPV